MFHLGTTTFQQTDKIKLNIGGEVYQVNFSNLGMLLVYVYDIHMLCHRPL